MEKEKVVKATLSPKAKGKAKKQEEDLTVSLDAQRRLAEILNDSPRLISLNGTEWEVRALRMGTQWLIAKIVADMAKEEESKTFGDIIKQFSINIPAILDVLTLCLLNDKAKIFEGGNPNKGYSKLYHATRNTLEWDCEVSEFGNLLFECLQLMDVDFFFEKQGYIGDFQKECLGEEEDENSRTEIIQSVTAIGDMVDFLKANPFIGMEQYIWVMNPAMIRIMTADNTHVRYLSEKEAQQRKAKVLDGKNLMNDLGIPIIG